MAYNLLFDTEFKNNDSYWKFINCKLEDSCLISNNKVFGIEQEIVLADITKLYLRFNYQILNPNVNKVYVGIQSGDKLYVNKKWAKLELNQLISIVEDIKEQIENESQYPGTIKVTVIRETRVQEEAK